MSTQPHNAATGLLDPLHLPDPEGDAPDPKVDALIAELEGLNLPAEDGIPLETFWHRLCMNLLIDSVIAHKGARTDYFVGGNMFIYFSLEQVRNRDYRGPDFFFVDQVPHTPMRESWIVWNEGARFPDAIIELSSPSTADEDRTTKFRIYEQVFKTEDYFIYDRAGQTLDGWHLKEKRYEPLSPNEQGRLWCSSLGLWVGRWRGVHSSYDDTWLRFFDSDGNVVPSPGEQEKRRADEQQRRADAAEMELARLRFITRRGKESPELIFSPTTLATSANVVR